MKSKAIYIILITLLVASVWQWRSLEEELQGVREQHVRMEAHAQELEKKVFELEQELTETQKQTVGGIAEEANSLLLEGWDAVLEEFEKKLEETKKRMSERLDQNQDPDADAEKNSKDKT